MSKPKTGKPINLPNEEVIPPQRSKQPTSNIKRQKATNMKTIRMTDQLLDAVKAVAQYEEVSEQELCASVIHDAMKAKLKLAKESAMQKAQSLSLD